MSPEKLNREVLRAIKLWDHYVFDRDVSGLRATSFSGKNFKKTNTDDSKKEVDEISYDQMEGEIQLQLDQSDNRQDKRPFFKVIHFGLI